jgi:hypothetical protein
MEHIAFIFMKRLGEKPAPPQCHFVYHRLGHPVPGGYKYGDLALEVGGVSDETIKYGREFCGTSTQEWLLWQGPEAVVQVITDLSSRQRGR